MARGKTLVKLLDDYRAACRLSLNTAHNNQARDAQIKALQQKQEFLWGDFDWPHLRVDRFFNLQAGQRYYDPAALVNEAGTVLGDIAIDRIQRIDVRWSGSYVPVHPQINDGHYAAHDSELDQRAWPVQRWMITEDEQIEVWPIPDQNTDETTLEGRVRVTGIRNLRPLLADTDVADLDDQIIVKLAAADYLAASGAKDAQLKLSQAERLYNSRRGQLLPKRKVRLFVGADERPRRPLITHYRAPT